MLSITPTMWRMLHITLPTFNYSHCLFNNVTNFFLWAGGGNICLLKYKKIHTIIQWLYTYYIIYNEKLDISNKVSIPKYCQAPKMANDKKEEVQLIYLSKDIMRR